MLKDYFIQKFRLRSQKQITDQDIRKFLQAMDATIKSLDKIIEQKIKEYLR